MSNKTVDLPGQTDLFAKRETRAQNGPEDWRRITVRAERIVAMMLQESGYWTLAQIRERCGGSDTGNSAALRRARKPVEKGGLGLQLDTKKYKGTWLYRLSRVDGC